ncbi:DUF2955 domain-containing protein [Pseudaeromonas sp. ZJS20]|uniref:DUF2955 domain-containing protein n=1 Tax=Pseudaeromonas aegiceratis TaxID=3153928 RepID=UPI00390C6C7F
MSSSAAIWRAPCLRLAVAPLAAMGLGFALGQPLPFLVGIFVIMLLMMFPGRPPLSLLLKLLLLVLATSLLVGLLARITGNQPVAFWLAMAALCATAFARLARNQADLPGMLILLVASLSMVLVQLNVSLPTHIAWMMGGAFAESYLWCLLAHALWPGALPKSQTEAAAQVQGSAWSVLAKTLALLLALWLALLVKDNSAVLIGATLANLLRASDASLVRQQGGQLLYSNLLGALVALPVVILCGIFFHPVIAALLCLCGSLWLTGRLALGMAPPLIQAALTVYLALLGSALPKLDQGFWILSDRVVTVLLTGLYCLLVMRLIHPMPTAEKPTAP